MKRDHDQIRKTVKKLKEAYGFKGPIHFTDFSNLAPLFNFKNIYSRNFCLSQDIRFYDVADQGIIQRTKIDVKDCVRFYFKEKTMTLYVNEGIKEDGANPHVPIPVYLLFNEEILYLDDTIFTDGNAGSRNTMHGIDNVFLNNTMDWDIIFHRGTIYLEDGPEKQEFKRKRQAELLSTKPISLNYLKKIIFRCNTDYQRACNIFGENPLYSVDRNMFNNKRNYIKDYSIEIIKLRYKRSLVLKFITNIPIENNGKHGYKLFDMGNHQLRKVFITYPESFNREYNVTINNLPNCPFKLKFWFYNVLSIEEQIE